MKRQGKAAFELAKKLIEKIGGFDTTADCSTGAAGATLDQAIQYLEIAVARDDAALTYHFSLGRAYSLRNCKTLPMLRAVFHNRFLIKLAAG